MTWRELNPEELLEQARLGSKEARAELLQRFREPLRQMLGVRFDPRLKSRIDVSDVIQDTLIEADRRLDEYLQNPPIAFYPWLRQMAMNRLIDAYRRHILAKRRAEGASVAFPVRDDSSNKSPIDEHASSGTTPSGACERNELGELMSFAIESLPKMDQQVIRMRHFERKSTRETAEQLQLTEAAVKTRLLRALQRLRDCLRGLGYE